MKVTWDDIKAAAEKRGIEEWQPDARMFVLGSLEARHRVLFIASTHGLEPAPALAMRWAIEGMKLPDDIALGLMVLDPEALDEEGYGFVDLSGNPCSDPPQRGYGVDGSYYQCYFDRNSEFSLSIPSIQAARNRALMTKFAPTFVHAAHETTSLTSPIFWNGAGILVIECYPIHPSYLNLLPGAIGGPMLPSGLGAGLALLEPDRWFRRVIEDWACGMFGAFRSWRARRHLRDHPGFSLVGKVIRRYKKAGGQLLQAPWQRRLENEYGGLMVGQGRLLDIVRPTMCDWLTASEWAVWKFGCIAVTTETFPPGRSTWGLDERAEQTYLFLKAIIEELADED
jgi:hypothetical protein